MIEEDRKTIILELDEDLMHLQCSTPEKVLCAAVLMGAILDIKKRGDVKRKARRFFMNKDDRYVFSFMAICSQLEIDPDRILKLKEIRESFRE